MAGQTRHAGFGAESQQKVPAPIKWLKKTLSTNHRNELSNNFKVVNEDRQRGGALFKLTISLMSCDWRLNLISHPSSPIIK